MKGIRNIIFDLGGVLIDINESETVEGFQKLFKYDLEFSEQWDQLPLVINSIETGKWSVEEFYQFMARYMKPGTDPKQIEDAWCALLGVFPVSRVKMVQELAKHYNLFLLSNTNPLHIQMFRTEFRFRYHYSMEDLFIKCYYSSDVGYRKPDPQIYKHVIADANLIAEETLMIDDRLDNCQSAESVGMKSINVPEDSGIEAIFSMLV